MKFKKSSASGIALIIVLGFLVILTALAVAFFSSVTTELKAARTFSGGVTTQQMADTAVQVVIGQIAEATTRGITTGGKGTEAWASQPGMIRVYGATGAPDSFYKLYSSNIMTVPSGSIATFTPKTDFKTTWSKQPALWTDLNAPVVIYDSHANNNAGASVPRFPIVDPRAYQDSTLTVSAAPARPVMYAGAWDNNPVEGFLYDATLAGTLDGLVGPGGTGGPNAQRLPMPVRWIYVLQDGTLTVPDDSMSTSAGPTTAVFNYPPNDPHLPTQKNPIVGRIAFWTDDETSKLNVNTAAGFVDNQAGIINDNLLNANNYPANPDMYAGSYWDSPRYFTQFDFGLPDGTGIPTAGQPSGGLALCQLLQNEFQRYPGHPATTSLAPVLKNYFTSEQVYALVPRYSNLDLYGGTNSTRGGAQRIFVDLTDPAAVGPSPLTQKQLQPKQDRLYASLDELFYGAHGSGTVGSNYARTDNISYITTAAQSKPAVTPDVWASTLDGLRFFLTAQSRAPELNLYGQPRVSAWPVRYETSSGVSGLNVFDNLILFCSTIGAPNAAAVSARPDTTVTESSGQYRYIFTRKEIDTPAPHVNGDNSPAGTDTDATGNFTNTYVPDWNQARNKTLLGTYLPQFFNLSNVIPGFGTTWGSGSPARYSAGDQQSVLTEIFDYIRCANSQDTTTAISNGKTIKFARTGYIAPSVPTYFAGVKGLGRMSTLCEATVDFYYAGPVMDPTYTPPAITGLPTGGTWSKWDMTNPGSRYVKVTADPAPATTIHPTGQMRAFVFFSTFDPMQGYGPKADPAKADPKMVIEASWATPWTVTVSGQSAVDLGFPSAPQQTTVYRSPGGFWGGRDFGGYEGFMHTLIGDGGDGSVSKHKIMWDAKTALDPANDYGETFDPSPKPPATPVIVKNFFTTVAKGNQEYYPFQSTAAVANVAQIPPGALNFKFSGGEVDVNLYYGGTSPSNMLQSFKINFPAAAALPTPAGAPGDPWQVNTMTLQTPTAALPYWGATRDVTTWNAVGWDSANTYHYPDPANLTQMSRWYWTGNGAFLNNNLLTRKTSAGALYVYNTSLQASWSFATRLAWAEKRNGDSNDPWKDKTGAVWSPTPYPQANAESAYHLNHYQCVVQPGDTIRSMLYWDDKVIGGSTPPKLQGTGGGDLRIAALSGAPGSAAIATTNFREHPDYLSNVGPSRACVLRGGDGGFYFPAGTVGKVLIAPTAALDAGLGNHINISSNSRMSQSAAFANLPWAAVASTGATPSAAVQGVYRQAVGSSKAAPGDWDQGLGNFPDGPYANKQDEGNVIYAYVDPLTGVKYFPIPYFTSTWNYQAPGDSFTSPSRQMPSAVMFGSLPAHVIGAGTVAIPQPRNWETLCFCPWPAGTPSAAGVFSLHPGNVDPKDHLLLDLFQMPIVEPYPISEPFSTAGKVNLNYRIVPFDYIRRSSALRGALYSVRVTAVNSQGASLPAAAPNYLTYKTGDGTTNPLTLYPNPIKTQNFRKLVDRDQTIAEIDDKYDNPLVPNTDDIFKSATQICEEYLIPWDAKMVWSHSNGEKNVLSWLSSNGDLTGDNEREKPYADLYPRVTTKSNTYTVHMRVQAVRQIPRTDTTTYNKWNEGKDAVLGEYRGSATIERYLDPADPRIGVGTLPNGTVQTNPDTQSLERLYRFRTVVSKKFAP